jgi:hypothetical protein
LAADAEQLIKRFDALKARRSILEGHCEEVAEFCSPRHMGFVGQRNANEKRMQRIYDSTGIHSLELLAAGLHGLATNPASKWFALRMVDVGFEDNDEVKDWLADTTDVMRAEMYAPGTGITTALNELYVELGGFGTSPMFIGERDAGGLLFQTRPLHECYIAENHEGRVDTIFRRSKMTARQMVQMWGEKSVSDDVRKFITDGKPDEMIEVVHAVYPRSDRERGKRNKINQAFASCYVECKTKHLLEESGFPEFPYAVPRWSKLPGEEYGRSPAMTALPDVKMLQEMMKTTIKAAQKAADPPLFVPDDGVVGPVRTAPGQLTFYRGERLPQALDIRANFQISLEMMEEVRNRIRTTFFADVLQIVSDTDMTATEVVQRTTERMRILGPIIGRLESELLGPMIERVFGILTRQKKIPPMPPSLLQKAAQDGAGPQYGIEFVSPIAMAQKQVEANAFTQTLGVLMPFVEASQSPEILRRFKPDAVAEGVWEIFGGDPDWMRTDEEIQAMDAEAKQAAAAAQNAQVAEIAAKAANQGAGALDKMASAQEKGADMSRLMPN